MQRKQNQSSLSSKSSQYEDFKSAKPSAVKKSSFHLKSDNVPKSSIRNSSIASSSTGTGLPKICGAMSVNFSNEDKQSKISEQVNIDSQEDPTASIGPSDYEHLYKYSSNISTQPPASKAKKSRQAGDFSSKVAAIRSRKSKSVKVKKSIPQNKSAKQNTKEVKPSPSVKPPKEAMSGKKINKKEESPTVTKESSLCVCCLIM